MWYSVVDTLHVCELLFIYSLITVQRDKPHLLFFLFSSTYLIKLIYFIV